MSHLSDEYSSGCGTTYTKVVVYFHNITHGSNFHVDTDRFVVADFLVTIPEQGKYGSNQFSHDPPRHKRLRD